jgi:hypothetical protein
MLGDCQQDVPWLRCSSLGGALCTPCQVIDCRRQQETAGDSGRQLFGMRLWALKLFLTYL